MFDVLCVLNMVNKNLIITAIHITNLDGPRLTAS